MRSKREFHSRPPRPLRQRRLRDFLLMSRPPLLSQEGSGAPVAKPPSECPRSAPFSYPLYLIRQIRFPPSSDTSTEPSGVTVTPTGRPHLLFCEGSTTKPVRKSSTAPGFPFWNGIKATLAPFVVERFQEPCRATNNPLR